jgi:hypothetical protein
VPAEILDEAGHFDHAGAPVEPVDDDDLDLLADSGNRPGRFTWILVGAIVAALTFLGGVAVQKHYGGSSSSPISFAGAGARTGAGGTGTRGLGYGGAGGAGGAGGYGSFGGFAGGAGAGTGVAGQGQGQQGGSAAGTGSGAAGSGAAGSGAAAATPVVVGTVSKLSGSTLVVKNFGGKSVTVKITAATTFSLPAKLAVSGLKKGTSVSVAGSTAKDGTVTASSVTATS